MFFYALDALTGGSGPQTTTRTVRTPVPATQASAQPAYTGAAWPYQGVTQADYYQSLAQAQAMQGFDNPPINPIPAWGYVPPQAAAPSETVETITETGGPTTPGRLATWAKEGSLPVEYAGLTPEQVRAAGGLGATRSLAARQIYGDRAEQLAADPSMTLAQRNYAGGLNTRELAQTQDAVSQEAEAAIAALLSQEKAREYEAAIRNSDLTARDLKDLADIYSRMFGTYSQSEGTSTNSGSGSSRGSGSGFNFGVDLW